MIDTDDMKRFERHVALFARAAGDDPAAFAQIVALLASAQDQLKTAYLDLRAQGFSAQDVANELGVSRQAVRQRYGVSDGSAMDDDHGSNRRPHVWVWAVNATGQTCSMCGITEQEYAAAQRRK